MIFFFPSSLTCTMSFTNIVRETSTHMHKTLTLADGFLKMGSSSLKHSHSSDAFCAFLHIWSVILMGITATAKQTQHIHAFRVKSLMPSHSYSANMLHVGFPVMKPMKGSTLQQPITADILSSAFKLSMAEDRFCHTLTSI